MAGNRFWKVTAASFICSSPPAAKAGWIAKTWISWCCKARSGSGRRTVQAGWLCCCCMDRLPSMSRCAVLRYASPASPKLRYALLRRPGAPKLFITTSGGPSHIAWRLETQGGANGVDWVGEQMQAGRATACCVLGCIRIDSLTAPQAPPPGLLSPAAAPPSSPTQPPCQRHLRHARPLLRGHHISDQAVLMNAHGQRGAARRPAWGRWDGQMGMVGCVWRELERVCGGGSRGGSGMSSCSSRGSSGASASSTDSGAQQPCPDAALLPPPSQSQLTWRRAGTRHCAWP